MSRWWGIEGCRCLTFLEARLILSGFAYSIFSDQYHDIWQNKQTGLYTLVEVYFDWGARLIKRVIAEGMNQEQLEKKLCSECPFYYEESEKEVLNEPCNMEGSSV